MHKTYRIVAALAALLLLAGLLISWPSLQDDALIHLRYADHLLHQHMVSYDGIHPSFGASSLLYISLLALLRTMTTSPLLPRIVSTIGHLVLFAGLAVILSRSLRSASKLTWLLAMVLLGTFAMPSSVRWLDDGMETSIVLIITAMWAFSSERMTRSDAISAPSIVWLVVLGAITTFLRIEMLMLLGFVSLILLVSRYPLLSDRHSFRSRAHLLLTSFAPLFGGLLSAAAIIAVTHSLLPDTALAKAFGISHWAGTLSMSVTIFESALSFGMVSLFLWILSVAAVFLCLRFSLAFLLANSLFPVTLALAALRGQAVQGIRYFEWTLLFPILWNILELCRAPDDIAPEAASSGRLLRASAYGLAVCLLLSLPVEIHWLKPVFDERSETLESFRAQHLERLQALNVVAFDVGYIGYFTGSPLCDMAGLVNGRGPARMSYIQRIDRCAAEHVDFAFGNVDQLYDLNSRFDLAGWSVCAQYKLANLRSADVHYLAASPNATKAVCSAAGNAPFPLKPLLLPPPDGKAP